MIRSATPRTSPDGFEPGATVSRLAGVDVSARLAPASYDEASRTVDAVFSTGARVRRWGVIEELAVTPEAIDLSRVASNAVRLLDSHNASSMDSVLGAVTAARIENGQLVGSIRFADNERGRAAEALVRAGDLTGISVGYRVTHWVLAGLESDVEIWRADRWELLEVSLVAVPADPAAMVRSGSTSHQQQEDDAMRRNIQPATGAAPAESLTPPVIAPAPAPAAPGAETRAAPVDTDALIRAERARSTEIRQIGATMRMAPAAIDDAVDRGVTVDEFRRIAINDHAARSESNAPFGHTAHVTRDEGETRRNQMTTALAIRLSPSGAQMPDHLRGHVDGARAYMQHSIVDMAAEHIGHRGRLGNVAAREEVLQRAMHTTSDFTYIFEGALNTALGVRYAAVVPTYRRLARQRTYMDFRDHNTVRPGDMPMLKEVTQAGEIKSGSLTEAKEKTAVKAYGIQLALSRQMLVNDSLGAIDRLLSDQANRVAIFEEKTFYTMLLSGSSSNGPTLLETSRQVFNTTDGTLAGTAAPVTTDSIALGRAAMRKQKDQSGEPIDVGPALILTGPDKETEAEKVLAPVAAAQASNVSIFSGKLEQVTTARIIGNAWYMFADPELLPCFEWGLLEGYAAPRLRMEEGFGVQGVKVQLEHDFGCGAIDFRGGYRNAGG